ncbi:hypothetical protein PARA125_000737 [Parachlamydia sp. AcF125]|nr:hypothetical protein [Parachlamydia sp. AcF125]
MAVFLIVLSCCLRKEALVEGLYERIFVVTQKTRQRTFLKKEGKIKSPLRHFATLIYSFWPSPF